jgi:hypothetical protein
MIVVANDGWVLPAVVAMEIAAADGHSVGLAVVVVREQVVAVVDTAVTVLRCRQPVVINRQHILYHASFNANAQNNAGQ